MMSVMETSRSTQNKSWGVLYLLLEIIGLIIYFCFWLPLKFICWLFLRFIGFLLRLDVQTKKSGWSRFRDDIERFGGHECEFCDTIIPKYFSRCPKHYFRYKK